MPLERHNADIMVPAVSVYSIECPWCDCMPFPDCLLVSSLSLAWSPSSLLLPMPHQPISSAAPTERVRDWLAGLWCCCLSLRSSLDCSDRFFNENRAAVVLQHVWLSIWQFLLLHFTQRCDLFFVWIHWPVSLFLFYWHKSAHQFSIFTSFHSWSLTFNLSISHFSTLFPTPLSKKGGKLWALHSPKGEYSWLEFRVLQSLQTHFYCTLSFLLVSCLMQQVLYVPHILDRACQCQGECIVKTSQGALYYYNYV